MEYDMLGSILIAALIMVLALLIFREVVNWYWKNNARLNELKQQTKLLTEIRGLLLNSNSLSANASIAPGDAVPITTICKNCGNPMQEGTVFCTKCGTENK